MNPAASSSRPRVLLGVSGSIASYKAVEVARLLVKAGAEVDVVMTKAATRFVGEATFAGITGRPVHTQMFAPGVAGERHVQLGAAAGARDLGLGAQDVCAIGGHRREEAPLAAR